jgi:lysophospholipase L1-like esterase
MFGVLRLSAERLLTAALILLAVTQAGAASSSKPACVLAATRFDSELTRTLTRLAEGRPITIVAVGSSSTAGAGATTSAAFYPSRLEALLQARFPHNSIRVINRGVNGEEEGDMLARFERDVIAEKPDLVLWQIGSNAVMRDRSLVMEEIVINVGVQRLSARVQMSCSWTRSIPPP